MNDRWYYSHNGMEHGPFSEAEIRDLAAQKALLESDLIWQEGSGRRRATGRGGA